MKKSKIIVPALGLLLLSTAATVSGSVAWFTANRTFSTSVSTFKVARLDGNLSCALDTLDGTHTNPVYGAVYNAAANDNPEYISVDANGFLLNASYDHVNKKVFYSEDGGTTLIDVTTTANWKKDTYNSKNYYYAISWKMTFSYEFTIDVTQQDLFFDNAASQITYATRSNYDSENNQKEAVKGFRLAFLNETEGDVQKLVWADQQEASKCTFIKNGSPATKVAYSAEGNGKLLDNAANADVIAKDGTPAANDNAKVNYLGKFVATEANSTQTLALTAVAWFEGTDENIVDGTYMDAVTASMSFFVHKHVA